ncbi:MAG: hypothetical protein AAAB21_04190, partial [Pseudomonas chlororaphis]
DNACRLMARRFAAFASKLRSYKEDAIACLTGVVLRAHITIIIFCSTTFKLFFAIAGEQP